MVVNATGVWADDVRALDEATHPHSIRPAKGIHVTVPRSKLPADIAAVIPVPKDRRSIFVVPWPDGDDVYLGTTDTDWDGPLDDPACLPEDVDYVLDAANGVITEPIGRQRRHRGVGGAAPAARSGPGAPRERPHRRPVAAPHRAGLGPRPGHGDRRQAHHLPPDGRGHRGHRGEGSREPRPGRGAPVPDQAARHPGLVGARRSCARPGPRRASGWTRTSWPPWSAATGARPPPCWRWPRGDPSSSSLWSPGLPHLRVEALWAVRQEMAMTVDDVLSRRTRSLLRRALAAAEAAPGIAELLAPEWGRERQPRPPADATAFADQARRDLARAGLDPVSTTREHPS